ncbi:hypothetical protein BH23PLA1_BH23PLA1_43910 [soil metagenome]
MSKLRTTGELEVPITPMLDVAFQLLTFFILTFKPAPVELQFNMNLLPIAPATEPETAPPPDDASSDMPAPLRTLTTTLYSDGAGGLGRVDLDGRTVDGIEGLRQQIAPLLEDPDLAFDQAVIRVAPDLHYAHLIEVIDLFAQLDLTKVSFTEIR